MSKDCSYIYRHITPAEDLQRVTLGMDDLMTKIVARHEIKNKKSCRNFNDSEWESLRNDFIKTYIKES